MFVESKKYQPLVSGETDLLDSKKIVDACEGGCSSSSAAEVSMKDLDSREWLRRAISELALRSADGYNLAMDHIRRAGFHFPLVAITKQRWQFSLTDPKTSHHQLAEQVVELTGACIAYLQQRLAQMGQPLYPPVDPWNEMAVLAVGEPNKQLHVDSELLRGTLETLKGVLHLRPPDVEAIKLAVESLAQTELDIVPSIEQAFELYAIDRRELSGVDGLPGELREVAKQMEMGLHDQARAAIQDIRAKLSRWGHEVRKQALEKRGTAPFIYACPECGSRHVQPARDYPTRLQCQLCAHLWESEP
jgi:hypothetical protein